MWRGFLFIFVGMKHIAWIGLLVLLTLSACDATTREARRMVKRAEQLADTLPDSTVRLIDSVLRMPANFSERERMDMALLQAEVLFGDHGQEISPVMDDDFFDEHANLSTSPELERAAAYYAGKKQYAKAAHAALYSGFVQQHYDEKEAAMRSFKEAEQYGKLAVDSLTIAQAEYWMGKMLYYEGRREEALDSFVSSGSFIGNHYGKRALIENSKAAVYILMSKTDSAYICLEKGLAWANKSHLEKTKRKVLNNYAVLCRLQEKYDDAIAHLKKMASTSNLNETEEFVLYLNMGKTLISAKITDSAALYFNRVETLISRKEINLETRASAYGALSQFYEQQGDIPTALHYKNQREELLSDVLGQRQQQAIYRIQKQYDYENLQNVMNRKLIRKQRLITLFGILTIIGLVVLAVSQIRLAKTRKKEAETNANLFHFMQQNKALVESNIEHEKKVLDTMQQLSNMYYARFKTMQKLSFSIENPKNKIALKDLEKVVFGDGEHWEAVKEVIDALYPGLRESVTYKYPEMDEMERRVFILSRFKLPRMEEAALLGISTSVLDKLRTRVHKIVEKDKKQ
jgi:tetratricopeptide (TPR) repeat protein